MRPGLGPAQCLALTELAGLLYPGRQAGSTGVKSGSGTGLPGLFPALEPRQVTAFRCASVSHLSNGADGPRTHITDSLQIKCVNVLSGSVSVHVPCYLSSKSGKCLVAQPGLAASSAELQLQIRREWRRARV